jgi:DNA polymerase-3 subunit gamma/tau
VRELAANSTFAEFAAGVLRLSLPESLEHLRGESLVRKLTEAVALAVGSSVKIEFVARGNPDGETLHDRTRRERSQRQAEAESSFTSDPAVQHLVERYGATVRSESIRPHDES